MPTVIRTSVHTKHTSVFSFSMFGHCKWYLLFSTITSKIVSNWKLVKIIILEFL